MKAKAKSADIKRLRKEDDRQDREMMAAKRQKKADSAKIGKLKKKK